MWNPDFAPSATEASGSPGRTVSPELQANIRIDWIHTPGSDLFVVIDTGYLTGDLLDPREPRWQRRTGVVKLTYLKAF